MVESKGLQEHLRVCLLQNPIAATAGAFTVNKTTAENELSSGGKKKAGCGRNNPFVKVLIP